MATIEKWRKLTVDIEAIQINEEADLDNVWLDCSVRQSPDGPQVFDKLNNEWVSFQYGDFIVQNVHGEYYPVLPEIFHATFREIASVHGWDVLEEVRAEMDRQRVQSGIQSHGSDRGGAEVHLGFTSAEARRRVRAVPPEHLMWADILMEAVAEVLDTDTYEDKIAELVRTGAVVGSWIECVIRTMVHNNHPEPDKSLVEIILKRKEERDGKD